MKKLVHIITGLNDGGAEAVLYRLCTAPQKSIRHQVISMLDMGKYGQILQDSGIEVYALNCCRGPSALFSIYTLSRMIRLLQADIVQTWMYHANLVGGMAAHLAGCKSVIWGIRHTNLDHNKKTTQLVSWLCSRLSRRIPSVIVCCSDSSAQIHEKYGYDATKLSVIYNGYDLKHFTPSQYARKQIRNELGVPHDRLLLGMVGRWNAQKDHANLLQALAMVQKSNSNVICLLVGPQITNDNIALAKMIEKYGLCSNVRLLGRRFDIPAIMNALDIHVLSSAFGEAFPNVVAEAMACGTPCIVTDVGDAGAIVGNSDWVVPPKQPYLLANAIMRAADTIHAEGRDSVGLRCRKRISNNFSLDRMVQAYSDLWNDIWQETLPG